MPYVYIVRCANGTLYTGWAMEVARRVAQHNAGRGARYTRMHRPVMLVYQEEAADRSAAMRREAAIKKLDREHKEQLICSTDPSCTASSPSPQPASLQTTAAMSESAGS